MFSKPGKQNTMSVRQNTQPLRLKLQEFWRHKNSDWQSSGSPVSLKLNFSEDFRLKKTNSEVILKNTPNYLLFFKFIKPCPSVQL